MRFFDSLRKIIYASLVGLMLTGCLGGGGSSSTTSTVVVDPNLSVPLQTAMANLVNNGFSKPFTISGWADNSTTNNPQPHTPISGNGTWSLSTPTPWVFDASAGSLSGTSALLSSQIVAGAVIEAGVSSPFTDITTYYFNTANYTLVAKAENSSTFIYQPYTYLSGVKAGDSGLIGASTTEGLFASSTTGSYSVASDQANSLLVTFSETTAGAGGGEVRTESVYRVDTSGNISPVSFTEEIYGLSATPFRSLTYTFQAD